MFGPGDPPASIVIDEQSVIFTMACAKNIGIWPRQPVEPPEPGGSGGDPPDVPVDPPPGVDPASSFAGEGVLREALVKIWEKARAEKIAALEILTIRMFEAGDGFRLLGAVGAVSGAGKRVTVTGSYETCEGGSFELEFHGPVSDAQPVREFLEPQLRDASSSNMEVRFDLRFENGLTMQGDAAEKLTERLSRFVSGAAYVSATVEMQK